MEFRISQATPPHEVVMKQILAIEKVVASAERTDIDFFDLLVIERNPEQFN